MKFSDAERMTEAFPQCRLAPWALRPTIVGDVTWPCTSGEVASLFAQLGCGKVRGVVPRGRGTAYGDVNVGREALHIMTERLREMIQVDHAGSVTCQSGVTLEQLISAALPQGWFPRVTPGTMLSTLGGCFACDVHGKNHHVAGSFASSVEQVELVLPNSETVTCSPDNGSQLFWDTAGGLGQTGLITKLTLTMMPVETGWFNVRLIRTGNLDETFDAVDRHSSEPYSACWIDSMARGTRMGRGILLLGSHAKYSDLGGRVPRWASRTKLRNLTARLSLPCFAPHWLTGPWTWRAFNELYYRTSRCSPASQLMSYRQFLYPLDSIGHWNRIFGRQGFLEYQCALPPQTWRATCLAIVERLSATGNGSFLAVLKRFGRANPAPMSFPIDGYTLAIDMSARGAEQAQLLDELDGMVEGAGGRIYLVKDSRMRMERVDAMYPEHRKWAERIERLDPQRMLTSSLVNRLALR